MSGHRVKVASDVCATASGVGAQLACARPDAEGGDKLRPYGQGARLEGRRQAPPLRRDPRPVAHRLHRLAPLAVLGLALLLGGCRGCPSSRPPIHLNPNMDQQPKLLPQAESAFFADGAAMRPPVPGTVARGQQPGQVAWREGRDAGGAWVAEIPLPVDARLLARGEDRYGVYCGPCHGPTANGKGMLFQRAQVLSADLLSARFRAMPVGQLFDEVTHGVGLMPAYGPQVPVADRWAILAFLRQLQAQTPLAGQEVGGELPQASGAAMAPAGTAAAPSAPTAATPAARETAATAAPGGEGSR